MPGLTDNQLASYQATGYVQIPQVIGPDEIARISAEMDRVVAMGDDKAPTGWLYAPHLRESNISQDLARDDRLLTLIERVVHPGISLHSSKLVTKLAHSDTICHWHQDEAFYFTGSKPEMASRTRMSIWIPLQDTDQANGCLWVVPGSHTDGIEDSELVGTGHCRRRILRSDYADAHAIPLPARAGDAVLFSAYLWHHSKANAGDQPRRAFIISYQEASIPEDGYGNAAVILRPAA